LNQAQLTIWFVKPVLFATALVPAGLLVCGLFNGALGANPVETITHETGGWGLRFLLLSLLVTPLRRITGWHSAIRVRRMLGLFAFFYVTLHFTTYVWLDHYFDLVDILDDILDRPYVTIGFTALVALIPLAATSTNAMVKRLGGKNWQRLHRLVYVASAAAIVHFLWLVKADLREPLIYLGIFMFLMSFRAPVLLANLRTRKHGGMRRSPP
jgi:sulfoxide reductase heme-binding subunit YedZ